MELVDSHPTLYKVSVACYAKVHAYDFHVIKDNSYSKLCPQKDPFFRRHCIVACLLKDYDYILFLDSDIGVVNPNRLIEDFIDPHVDITFYDRFYNWEVVAGSYIVKNSTWSINFLYRFAQYESHVPKMAIGSDNGALHAYLAEALTSDSKQLPSCLLIYEHAKEYGSLFLYEACIREIFGNRTRIANVAILKKGTGWARDHIITNSKWSMESDFMIHNWKTSYLKTYEDKFKVKEKKDIDSFSGWYSPFAGNFDLTLCTPKNRTWHYDVNLIAPQETIKAQMADYEEKVEGLKAKLLNYLPRILEITDYERGSVHENEVVEILSTMDQAWEAYVP
ncbi:unnamed protein product [Cylicocyclus nassatus]|uniref:Nucleotide-diphospho-sugar transferase n=1 Tax=Cylicocyclus nassatus TaxID=53992 RepID=A0AA36DQ96_CYLNA|nr:unnamed protein product [Cylicocyclus nassatus]